MLEPENNMIELAVKIADLLVDCPSEYDAQAACGIAREITELRVRKISFGRVDHRLAQTGFPRSKSCHTNGPPTGDLPPVISWLTKAAKAAAVTS